MFNIVDCPCDTSRTYSSAHVVLLSPIMFQKQESLQVVIYVVRFSLEKTPGGQEVRRVLDINKRTAFTNTIFVYCRLMINFLI